MWLPSIIKSFSNEYPNIDLSVTIGDHGDLISALASDRIDLAFMCAPVPNECDFISFLKDPINAVVPLSSPIAAKETVSIRELLDYDFIIPAEGADEDITRVFEPLSIMPKIKYRIKNDEVIIAMIEHDLGISVMPDLIAQRHSAHVSIVPLVEKRYRTLGIAYRKKSTVYPPIKSFLDLSLNFLRTQLAFEIHAT